MAEAHQITILKKNNKILTSFSPMPIEDVYAMLYAAIKSVADQTGQGFKPTLAILDGLNNFAISSGLE